MRTIVRTKIGAVIASVVVSIAAGGGIWQAGGWGFHDAVVTVTAPATATGSATLSAVAPGESSRVDFKVDGVIVGTDVTAPYSFNWDSTGVIDGVHTVTATATGTHGSGTSDGASVTASNGVAPARFVSTTGADSGTCSTSGTACATFDYAYQQASCGDVVSVASGAYARQTIAYQAAKDSCVAGTRVSFEPAVGATVTLNSGLRLGQADSPCSAIARGPTHIAFRSMSIAGASGGNSQLCNELVVGPRADDVLIDGFTITGTRIVCGGCSNTTISNTTDSAMVASASMNGVPKIQEQTLSAVLYQPSNVTLDHVTFHDINSSDTNLYHIECLFLSSGDTITVKNSTFYNCQLYDIFIQVTSTPTTSINSLKVINNSFGQSWTDAAFTLEVGTALYWAQNGHGTITSTGDVFAHNSTTLSCAGCVSVSKNLTSPLPNLNLNADDTVDATMTGNIGGNYACIVGLGTLAYNHDLVVNFSAATRTATCGTDTKQAWNAGNFGYTSNTDPPNTYTLAAGSAAIGLVPVAECTTALGAGPVDTTGASRPAAAHSTLCNAGAYENR